jgi:hypothetical protein
MEYVSEATPFVSSEAGGNSMVFSATFRVMFTSAIY